MPAPARNNTDTAREMTAVSRRFYQSVQCRPHNVDAVAQIVKSGHDVAGHAYLQDKPMNGMTPEEEETTIKKCLDLLEKTSGQRPTGWVSPSMAFSPHTHERLAAAGLKWHGDARDNDVPRVVDFKKGQMAHIPWSDFTDNRVLRSSSMDLCDVYKETFDYLKRTQGADGSWTGGHVGPVFITAVHLTILQLDNAVVPLYMR